MFLKRMYKEIWLARLNLKSVESRLIGIFHGNQEYLTFFSEVIFIKLSFSIMICNNLVKIYHVEICAIFSTIYKIALKY